MATGSSKGIGRAIALTLAAEGAEVVVCARGQRSLDAQQDARWIPRAAFAREITPHLEDARAAGALYYI
jgi:NAD(P)-dependent dehydrogenase (short-subunit alcohol dehydrogenase family)